MELVELIGHQKLQRRSIASLTQVCLASRLWWWCIFGKSWFSRQVIVGNSFQAQGFALMEPKLIHCRITIDWRELGKSQRSWGRLLLSPLAPILEPELVTLQRQLTQRRTPIHSCQIDLGRFLSRNASCMWAYHSWKVICLFQRNKAWSNCLTDRSASPRCCLLMVWFQEISWKAQRKRPGWTGTCCSSWSGHRTPWTSLNQYGQSSCTHFFAGLVIVADSLTQSKPFQFENFEVLFGSNYQSMSCFPKCCLQSLPALPAAAFHIQPIGSKVFLLLRAAVFCGFRVLAAQNW